LIWGFKIKDLYLHEIIKRHASAKILKKNKFNYTDDGLNLIRSYISSYIVYDVSFPPLVNIFTVRDTLFTLLKASDIFKSNPFPTIVECRGRKYRLREKS